MNFKNSFHKILIIILVLCCKEICCQSFLLKIYFDTNEKIDFNYQINHSDSISVKNEISKISESLIGKGYFFNQLDSITFKSNNANAYFKLNAKTSILQIKVDDEIKELINNKSENILTIKIDSLEKTINNITQILERNGKPFSKIYLKDFLFKDSLVFASLKIENEKIRTVDKIVVKGYENFPKKFQNHFLKNKIFNEETVLKIDEDLNKLNFISSTKTPEVLFTKDSTYIYVYLEKKQNSNIDANINFTSNTQNELIFNGKVDLELVNIFNRGNNYKLLWNSVSQSIQFFQLAAEFPYIFNTKFKPSVKFSIFRQDSTFINNNFNLDIGYLINNQTSVYLLLENESSNSLINNSNTTSFEKTFLGLGFGYFKNITNSIFRNKFDFNLNIYFGDRTSNQNETNQIKLNINSSYLWELNNRNYIYSKIDFGLLNSDNFIQNELFRIGGANSIRGFAEQSIFTQNFIITNLEYRFLTNSTSYLYTLTDLGWITTNNNDKTLATGLGFGYLFNTKQSQINIALAVNKTSTTTFDFKNSQVIIGWKNFF